MDTQRIHLPQPRRLMLALAFPVVAAVAWPGASRASDGHDHGEAKAAPAAAALPRFAAKSEAFELVGVINDKQLTMYLDHAATNAPVKEAKLSLDIGGTKVTATAHGEGEFVATLPQPMKAGVTPVTAAVSAAGQADLLAGEIDIHADAHADEHVHRSWMFWAAVAGGALAVLTGVAVLRKRACRSSRYGSAA